MPWPTIIFMGYAAGAFPPCRTSFSDFLKAAHTLALAQAEAHRAVKAASSKATVGSAYEMAPAYPKTDSDDDRAAAARPEAHDKGFGPLVRSNCCLQSAQCVSLGIEERATEIFP